MAWDPAVTPSSGGGLTPKVGTLAAIVAVTPVEGDVGYPSDSPYRLVCHVAGTWTYYHPAAPGIALTPPPAAGWTWDNQRTATVSAADGGIVLLHPVDAVVQMSTQYYDAPAATPWTVTFLVAAHYIHGQGGVTAGVGLYEKATRKACLLHNNGTDVGWSVQRWTTPESYSSDAGSVAKCSHYVYFARLGNNGTNVTYEVSIDGVSWEMVLSEAKGTFFTTAPDAIFIGGYSQNHFAKVAIYHQKAA